jgi:dipeptide/tripeptide permease
VYHVSQYTKQDWADIKRIMIVFIGLPIYWALYYQQNSTWVNQANQMNTDIIWNTPGDLQPSSDLCLARVYFSMERVTML